MHMKFTTPSDSEKSSCNIFDFFPLFNKNLCFLEPNFDIDSDFLSIAISLLIEFLSEWNTNLRTEPKYFRKNVPL